MFFNYKTVKTILSNLFYKLEVQHFLLHMLHKNHTKILFFKKVISNLIKKQKNKNKNLILPNILAIDKFFFSR